MLEKLDKEFGFQSKCDEKALEGSKQKSHIVLVVLLLLLLLLSYNTCAKFCYQVSADHIK